MLHCFDFSIPWNYFEIFLISVAKNNMKSIRTSPFLFRVSFTYKAALVIKKNSQCRSLMRPFSLENSLTDAAPLYISLTTKASAYTSFALSPNHCIKAQLLRVLLAYLCNFSFNIYVSLIDFPFKCD